MVRKIFSSVVDDSREKPMKVIVPKNAKVEDFNMLLGQLKSADLRIDQKQEALNSRARQEQKQAEQNELNNNLV